METKLIVIAYCIYLPVALGLTYYVAKNLFKSGIVFMRDIFKGREEIAHATNKLFELGFYLLNIGFALVILKIDPFENTTQEMIELMSVKIGGFAIYLGIMMFFNLYLFFRGKKKSNEPKIRPFKDGDYIPNEF